MLNLRACGRDESLTEYAKEQAFLVHEHDMRRNGKPYTSHLEAVTTFLDHVLLPDSSHRDAAISAGWFHDAVEDSEGLDVRNPYSKSKKEKDKTYLNDLLGEKGEKGRWTCYMVDRMTHRSGHYDDYMESKFRFSQDRGKKHLDILTLIAKMCDRTNNAEPHELIDCSRAVEKYSHLKDGTEEDLKNFYKRQKVFSVFKRRGDFSYNPTFFEDSMRQKFLRNKNSSAIDNIYTYVPWAEKRLLMEEKNNNAHLYNTQNLRTILKQCLCHSIGILLENNYIQPQAVYELAELGRNRRNKSMENYVTIAEEVQEEILSTGTVPFVGKFDGTPFCAKPGCGDGQNCS